MRDEVKTTVQRLRVAAVVITLFITLCFFAPTAFAADANTSPGQTGSGNTSLVLHLQHSGEYGGISASGAYANPDLDGDGLGDNLAFTVPTRIDFLATPDGTLRGPSSDIIYIENESAYPVHVSALKVSALNGWNIVQDAVKSTADNSIDIMVGPIGDRLNGASYLEKGDVSYPHQWNMSPRASEGVSDRVHLEFSGHINNVVHDLSQELAFGQIEWYVTAGSVTGD